MDSDCPDCPICLEPCEFSNGEAIALQCGHVLHANCLAGWLDRGFNTCPVCRATAKPHPFNSQSDPNLDQLLCMGLLGRVADGEQGPIDVDTGSDDTEQEVIDVDAQGEQEDFYSAPDTN